MKNLHLILLFFNLVLLSACDDWSFTDEDIQEIEIKKEKAKKSFSLQEVNPAERDKNTQDISHKTEETVNADSKSESKAKEEIKPLSEDEITRITKNIELAKDAVIQNKKVVLDMMTIQTNEHDLTIRADEFVSNHSVILNFPEGQQAKEKEDGKSGGNILIKAKTAKGNLKLILNGENGGFVPKRRILNKDELSKLKGSDGENGSSAVYKQFCRTESFLILKNKKCWDECVVSPTRGQEGGDGHQGYPGFDGKHGGNSSSFHLKAFHLSDFYLTDIEKIVGLGSQGGKGSSGGLGGKAGRNGRDDKALCRIKLSRAKKGRRGERGSKGIEGKNGGEGTICLENLAQNQKLEVQKNNNQKEPEFEIQQNNKAIQTKTICDEGTAGIICSEVIVQNWESDILEESEPKGKVICY